MEGGSGGEIDREASREGGRQAGRQAGRQTGRQAGARAKPGNQLVLYIQYLRKLYIIRQCKKC